MKNLSLIVFISLWFYSGNLSAQKKECQGQLSLAEDFYASGDFDEALRLLDQFQECAGVKNSDYYKLISNYFHTYLDVLIIYIYTHIYVKHIKYN